MVSGMGKMYEILGSAGQQAQQDVLREAPPMYAMARLAALFRPLPPLGRGIAAIAISVLGLTVALIGLRWLLTRQA